MQSLALHAQDVKTGYGKFTIEDISFSLQQGDILGLVGRSGSGKSTLIKTLIGEKAPLQGTIGCTFQDKDISLNTIVGYSPQQNALYPFLSIKENMITFGRLHGIKKKTILHKMPAVLSRLDLTKAQNKKINELSGGMQKRADLATALIVEPEILVLDEPFTGLDVSLQKFIWVFLKELAHQGKIIVVSSHMLQDIQKHCTQYGLISQGQFYNTEQIDAALKKQKIKLETYLEHLFTHELLQEEQKK